MNVVVLGASDNPMRYSFLAVNKLLQKGHTVFPVSIKKGTVAGIPMINSDQPLEGIDIVTVYLGENNQPQWYDFILGCKPGKLILNPGAENDELTEIAENAGIRVMEACTLVLLQTNTL